MSQPDSQTRSYTDVTYSIENVQKLNQIDENSPKSWLLQKNGLFIDSSDSKSSDVTRWYIIVTVELVKPSVPRAV